jgi:hypothetical protein
MPFGKFASCADFGRVLALGSLGRDSVAYLLRQHADECDCGCEICAGFRLLLELERSADGDE